MVITEHTGLASHTSLLLIFTHTHTHTPQFGHLDYKRFGKELAIIPLSISTHHIHYPTITPVNIFNFSYINLDAARLPCHLHMVDRCKGNMEMTSPVEALIVHI